MADQIRIAPDQVHSVASEFRNTARATQEQMQKLKALMDGMEAEWQGMTSKKFYGEFRQWTVTVAKFVETLDGISRELDTVANEFQRLDETLIK